MTEKSAHGSESMGSPKVSNLPRPVGHHLETGWLCRCVLYLYMFFPFFGGEVSFYYIILPYSTQFKYLDPWVLRWFCHSFPGPNFHQCPTVSVSRRSLATTMPNIWSCKAEKIGSPAGHQLSKTEVCAQEPVWIFYDDTELTPQKK